MKRMLFIYNPRAGKGAVRSQLSHILEELASYDYQIVVCPTREAQDAARIVEKEGRGTTCLCAAAGTVPWTKW